MPGPLAAPHQFICALTEVPELFCTPMVVLPTMLLLLATRLFAAASMTKPLRLPVMLLQVKVGMAGVSWKTPRMPPVTLLSLKRMLGDVAEEFVTFKPSTRV